MSDVLLYQLHKKGEDGKYHPYIIIPADQWEDVFEGVLALYHADRGEWLYKQTCYGMLKTEDDYKPHEQMYMITVIRNPVTAVSYLQSLVYDDYLKTDHWKQVRSEAVARAGNRCQICNSDQSPLHVHHRTYERRGQEYPADLIALCAECHKLFHDKSKIEVGS